MPKNRIKFATPAEIHQQLLSNNLLRRSRTAPILSSAFNAALDIPSMPIFTDTGDFATALRTTVDSLILKGFDTFKSGSCFADLAPSRPRSTQQYNDDYFFREQAVVVPVLIEDDTEGSACETQANILPQMVNVRKIEGNGTTCGFARKEFVRSSHSLSRKVDLLFLQGR